MPPILYIFISFFILCIGAVSYFTLIAPYRVEFVTHTTPIENLPAHLHGAKVVQISDIHTGYRVPNRFLKRIFAQIDGLQPEYVVFTGDYITQERTTEVHNLRPVMAAAPRGTFGTVGILGNHDYGYLSRHSEVAELIVETLASLDIPILRNQKVELNGLTIVGLDDYRSPNFNPESILETLDHQKATLVLAHNPDTVDVPGWHGYRGWIFAGHTHGGQVNIPGVGPLLLPLKNWDYAAGEVPLADGRHLYVNRGLGHLTKLRVNVPPEVTVHILEEA